MARYLAERDVVELELNQGKGWRGDDLWFLSKFPHLKAFEILDLCIKNVEPIHFLHDLRRLNVTTYCSTEIRFLAFPRLEDCTLEWRRKANSLFDCCTLKKLFVNRYKGKDVSAFGKLTNLQSLAILNAPVRNLQGLASLKQLRSLRLAGLRRLTSLEGIEGLTDLEELEVHTCRAIRSIEQIGSLSRLRKLLLNNDGDIESLMPLEKLKGLEWVLSYDSTNIVDGDLSPLLRLPNLSRVSFANRRHYSHRREEFRISPTGH
jgi:hypothetical protein